MGSLKGTAEIAIGKAKELVAEILGNGKLREESKLDQRKARRRKNNPVGLNRWETWIGLPEYLPLCDTASLLAALPGENTCWTIPDRRLQNRNSLSRALQTL
jgi:hypothetical protein